MHATEPVSQPSQPSLRPAEWRGFQGLMPHRIHDILVVSSLYDSFILAEDGQLYERILAESEELNLRNVPGITRVSTARLQRLKAVAWTGCALTIARTSGWAR